MADQLATTTDLASFMQIDPASLNTATATLLIECATAAVQQAGGGQRIVQVAGDTCSILSTSESWLELPQIPVTSVASVVLDGVTLTVGTDYKVFGNRLWRVQGWQNNLGWTWGWDWQPTWLWPVTTYPFPEPSLSAITYTHGYAAGAQELQLARLATLSLARGVYINASGVSSEHIDDYSVTFSTMATDLEMSKYLRNAIRKAYGRRAGLVRI
jgi:hypothetical protein